MPNDDKETTVPLDKIGGVTVGPDEAMAEEVREAFEKFCGALNRARRAGLKCEVPDMLEVFEMGGNLDMIPAGRVKVYREIR